MKKVDTEFWEEDTDEKLYSQIILALIIFHIALFFISTIAMIKINNKINEIKDNQLKLHEYILNRIEGKYD